MTLNKHQQIFFFCLLLFFPVKPLLIESSDGVESFTNQTPSSDPVKKERELFNPLAGIPSVSDSNGSDKQINSLFARIADNSHEEKLQRLLRKKKKDDDSDDKLLTKAEKKARKKRKKLAKKKAKADKKSKKKLEKLRKKREKERRKKELIEARKKYLRMKKLRKKKKREAARSGKKKGKGLMAMGISTKETPKNEIFDKKDHNKPRNYYQLIKKGGNTEEFINDFFRIDPDSEKLYIYNLEIKEKAVKNRFKIRYYNRAKNLVKWYYIDINFQDGKDSTEPYEANEIVEFIVKKTKEYEKNYDFTMNKECEIIQQHTKATEIECTPMVNDKSYVVPLVYDVKYTAMNDDNEQEEKRETFVVSPIIPGQASRLNKNGAVKNIGDKKLVEVAGSVLDSKGKGADTSYLERKDIQGRLKKEDKIMEKIENDFKRIGKNVDRHLLGELKENLWQYDLANVNKESYIEKTKGHMNELAERINKFSMETAVAYANHSIDFVNKYDQYLAESNGAKSDNKIGELIDYLDYLWYMRDKYMDEHFQEFLNKG